MKYSIKLIISELIYLYFLCIMPKMCTSVNKCCKIMSCKSKSSSNGYNNPSVVESPFRLKDHQPESCGCPGFGLLCDPKLGLLMELPNAGNFILDDVHTSNSFKEITLSDPKICLPQKLLSLNLTETVFRIPDSSRFKEFWVYNCSTNGQNRGNLSSYEEIDCMKGSNYTIIVSVTANTIVSNYSECRFLRTLLLATKYALFDDNFLSNYTSLYLTWDEQDCELCESSKTSDHTTAIFGIIFIVVVVIFIGSAGSWVPRLSKLYYELAARSSRIATGASLTANTDTNRTVVSHTQSSTPSSSFGLNQVTINSYPTIVIGESRSLIKPDDNCAICLSDYSSGDTLRILPECLHRFHADCIDLWLASKPICPICRTCPPYISVSN